MLPKEEDIFISMPTAVDQKRQSDSSSKMAPRPPFLSAYDYTFYLKRQLEKERIESGGLDDSDDEILKDKGYSDPLMGLSIETPKLSDLLIKLAEDLRSHRGSFVDDFIDEPQNGISWILDLLRSSLNRQQCPGMVISGNRDQPIKGKIVKNRERQHHLKRAMTDEYDCLLCLKHVTISSQKALNKILAHRNGLLTLASCITSNLTKSRTIALELLTKVCDIEPDGGRKVLEAMSTMRIIFGESVRFKLLIAILNSSSGALVNGFEATVLTFLNILLERSASGPAERVRLQSELEESGLNIKILEKKAKEKSLPPDDPIWSEIRIWNERYIDVSECIKKNKNLIKENSKLKEEVETLQRTSMKLEEDKVSLMHIERELKEKTEDLESEIMVLRARLTESGIKINCRRRCKSTNRPGSDNSDPVSCAVDSGRWSDSEGIGQENGRNSGGDDKKAGKQSPDCVSSVEECTDDQNVRNEDIFIYIPSIRPPANFNNYIDKNSRISTPDTLSSNKGAVHHRSSENLKSNRKHCNKTALQSNGKKIIQSTTKSDSKWKSRQLGNGGTNDSSEEDRPQIIETFSKIQNGSRSCGRGGESSSTVTTVPPATTYGHELDCSASIVGADCEDIELMLDWQYPKIDSNSVLMDTPFQRASQFRKSMSGPGYTNDRVANYHHNQHYPLSNHSQHHQHHHQQRRSRRDRERDRSNDSRRKRSQSTGFLIDHRDELAMVDNGGPRSEAWDQFLMRTRGASVGSLNNVAVTSMVNVGVQKDKRDNGPSKISSPPKPMDDSHNQGNNNNGSSSNGSKSKNNFASSLQSYFFSGGSGKHKSDTNSLRESCESSKSFPLPNVYKKNFISKGHTNCGLYSGSSTPTGNTGKLISQAELSQRSASSVSKMLHREITLAAQEVGAFY
ncbi:multiple wing hairs isoform X2 [Brevipalpus obovatus]